jgi:anaerobic ribonucleoside-triphosphate reductase activating protein
MDISNGEGVGVSLFVQGCDRHCFNCFNSETWDFNGGKEWTEEAKNKFMELIDRPYIRRISVLGGEPLAEQNLDEVLSLIKEIRISFPKKSIWLYTGYELSEIIKQEQYEKVSGIPSVWSKRWKIISNIDVLVDGEYIDEQKDLTLKWRGSKNQNCIDVKQSLAQNKVVLYCD